MQITHRFTLPAGVEEAWTAFYFPNRIAPCFPGATLGRVDGDEFDGALKIKLGPAPIEYQGTATFLERSDENQRIVVEAHGTDRRGRGSIAATVSMTFTEAESGTNVDAVSTVELTGQTAGFGETVVQEATDRLVQRLVECLSGRFASGLGDPPSAEELAMSTPRNHPADRPEVAGPSGPGPPHGDGSPSAAVQSGANVVERPPPAAVEARPQSFTVATFPLPLIRRFGPPVAGTIVLVSVIGGIVRRFRH